MTVSAKPLACVNYIREQSTVNTASATLPVMTFATTLLIQLCTLYNRDLSAYTADSSAAIEGSVEEALERLFESVDDLHEQYVNENVSERLLHAAFASAASCVVCSNPKLPAWQPFLLLPTSSSSNASSMEENFEEHAPNTHYLVHSMLLPPKDKEAGSVPVRISSDELAKSVFNIFTLRKSITSSASASASSSSSSSSSASLPTSAPAVALSSFPLEHVALGAGATLDPSISRNPSGAQPVKPNATRVPLQMMFDGFDEEEEQSRSPRPPSDGPLPQLQPQGSGKSSGLNSDGSFSGQDLLKLLDANTKQSARVVRRLLNAGLLRNHSADKPLVETFEKLDKYTQYTVWVRAAGPHPFACSSLYSAVGSVSIDTAFSSTRLCTQCCRVSLVALRAGVRVSCAGAERIAGRISYSGGGIECSICQRRPEQLEQQVDGLRKAIGVLRGQQDSALLGGFDSSCSWSPAEHTSPVRADAGRKSCCRCRRPGRKWPGRRCWRRRGITRA